MGDPRCPGDNEPGLNDETARSRVDPRILDSIRSRTGAYKSARSSVCTACNLELATDFGGMHLPPAVKGLSVLCPRVVNAAPPGRKQQKVIAIRRRAGSPPKQQSSGKRG
jgi:hypothetical protein